MRLLLDTHTLLWAAHEPQKLSRKAADAIEDPDNEVFVSAVSAIEIATKDRKGRLEYSTTLSHRFVADVSARGFDMLSIHGEHAQRAGSYAGENQDPWDRLLVAQAQIEGLLLVSCDKNMGDFGINVFW